MSMVSSDQVCHREPFNLGLLPRITLLLLNEPRGYSMEPMPRRGGRRARGTVTLQISWRRSLQAIWRTLRF